MSEFLLELACAAAREHGPQRVKVYGACGASQRLAQAFQLQALACDADLGLSVSASSSFA